MENKNTIELNVVRLGGGTSGSQPTKLSELTNDCGFVERNAFMHGQHKTHIGCYIESGVEHKVLTKTKGQSINITFATDSNWGSMSTLYKLQLIIKDMNGNEVVRFPTEDVLNNKLATPSFCTFHTADVYLEYEADDGSASIPYSGAIPENCELFISCIDGTERYVVANATINGPISVEQVMGQKADITSLGTAAYKSVEEIVELVKQQINA